MVVRVDPTPVNPIEEVIGLLAGLRSHDYHRGALWHRDYDQHHSPRRPHPVLLEHRCPEKNR